MVRSHPIVLFRIEAYHLAGSGAARSSGSLGCGCLTDATDLQRRQSGPRGVGCQAGQTAVDDCGYSFYRHGALSNIRREDEFSVRTWRYGAVLLGRRKVSMQWQDEQPGVARERLALAQGSPDLGDARKEGQDIATVLFGMQQFHSLSHPNVERLGRVRQMPE